MPLVYGDVQKTAKDLINNDYVYDRKFKLTSRATNGVTFTTEGAVAKDAEGKFGAKFKIQKLNVDKLQVTTKGRFISEMSVDGIVPHLKISTKLEDGIAHSGDPKGSITGTYTQDMFTVVGEVNLADGIVLTESATFEYEGFIAGAEIKYNPKIEDKEAKGVLVDAGALIGYRASDFSVSLQSSKKGKNASLAFHHIVNPDTSVALLMDFEPKASVKTFSVGATHRLSSETSIATKIESNGIISASLIQQLKPDTKLVASTTLNSTNFAGDSHKFGMQLILG